MLRPPATSKIEFVLTGKTTQITAGAGDPAPYNVEIEFIPVGKPSATIAVGAKHASLELKRRWPYVLAVDLAN